MVSGCLEVGFDYRRVGSVSRWVARASLLMAMFLPVMAQAQLFGLQIPHIGPFGKSKANQLEKLRETVMTAWLNPTPLNIAKIPQAGSVQVGSGPSQCAPAYLSAGDMIRRHQTYHVSDQIGRGDACAKQYGIVFDDEGHASPQTSSTPMVQARNGEHINANGCTVRGDSTKCPPSVSQMNNYAAVKVAPEAANKKMRLSPDMSKDDLWKLGSDYYSKRMYTQASGVFWQGANDGDPRAEAALGNMYASGVGVSEDPKLAMYWLGEGARGGNRGAEYAVAVYWEDGTELPPDIKKAMVWYMKSAEQGFDRAEMRVGFGYYFGEGVAENRAMGLRWIKKSRDDGYGPAGVYYETLTNPRSPKFRTFDQFSAYVAQLQAVQTEKVLAIMRSGFQTTHAERNGWEDKARALDGKGEYSRASSCRAIGTYC